MKCNYGWVDVTDLQTAGIQYRRYMCWKCNREKMKKFEEEVV